MTKPDPKKPKRKAGRPRVRAAGWDAARKRAATQAAQDIGKIPRCKNPKRRKKCEAEFGVFCKTYFPEIFYLPWSKDQRKVIAKVERVVIDHDMLAVAMPRGSGKTRLCQAAVLWAELYGRHLFAVIIGATAPQGSEAIEWFKKTLTENELLYQDFPAVCFPIRLLENEPRRCLGQRYKGQKTNIRWGKDKIVLPTIPGGAASGAVIAATSLEGQIRGMWHTMPDGRVVRPTLALPDDPQTAESARSQGPSGQTTYRLKTIKQDVQGLAGPDQQTAILIPCTVIERGDLADQLLDRRLYPEFRGERTKRLYSWPTNKALWEQYRELREQAMQTDQPLDEAKEFYCVRMCQQGRKLDTAGDCAECPNKANCMDCGAVVDWAERLDDPRNLTAVQAAMHAFYKYGPAGFAAEFQNEPLTLESVGHRLTPEILVSRVSGRAWSEVPLEFPILTCAIDVQQYSLWYLVVAWKMNFTGHVVDYGVWPEQQRRDVTKADIENSSSNLQARYPNRGIEGTIQAGLEDLVSRLLARNFQKSGGAGLARIGQMLVDSGKWPNVIHAVKTSKGGAVMSPSRGEGIGAGGRPMASRKRKEGERWDTLGRWYFPAVKGTREFPACVIDTNWWKSFVHAGFLTAPGDPGAITLFGDDPERHSLFASHITAETYVTPTSPKGIPVDEWTLRPSRPDNEWLDCAVGCAVAASMLGCKRIGNEPRGAAKIINVPTPRWAKKF